MSSPVQPKSSHSRVSGTGSSLGTKLLVVVSLCFAAFGAANIYFLRANIEEEAYTDLESKAQAVARQAESAIEYFSELHDEAGVFDHSAMTARLQASLEGTAASQRIDVIRSSAFYRTIPVVSAWSIARDRAAEAGYEFRTPRANPRNPANAPDAFEAEMLRDLAAAKTDSLCRIDEAAGKLRVMRPVKLQGDCMSCHGTRNDDPDGDGIDPIGLPMEGLRVGDMYGAFEVICDLGPTKEHVASATQKASVFTLASFGIVLVVLSFMIRALIGRPLARSVAVLERVAAGDLTVRVAGSGGDEVGRISAALDGALDQLQATLRNVDIAATTTSDVARALAGSAEQLSLGAQTQAASLEETAASLEEITATARKNAESAQRASGMTHDSSNAAEAGGKVMSEAIATMIEVKTSSKRISDIISTIDELSFQTNLLALNAAVEAARAGEQGRGFAVVASEVRSLAQRSATSAREIRELIADSVSRIEHGTDFVTRSGESLSGIVKSFREVNDVIGEIAAASQEQSTGVDEVNVATSQMDRVVQSNAAQTEELATSARELLSQADELKRLVSQFRINA